MLNMDKICDVRFFDKDGNEIMRFDKITNLSLNTSICADELPTVDINLSACNMSFKNDDEQKNKRPIYADLDPLNDKYFMRVC